MLALLSPSISRHEAAACRLSHLAGDRRRRRHLSANPSLLKPIALSNRPQIPSWKNPSFSVADHSLALAARIHAQTIKSGLAGDLFTRNNLLLSYTRCGTSGFRLALNLFNEMPHRRNLVSWTSIISAAIRNSQPNLGLTLYVELMRAGFCPNEFALASVLRACATLNTVRLARSVHSFALRVGLESDRFVGSSLVYMYATCGDIGASERAFECVDNRDLACWNAMVEGYALNDYGIDAMRCVLLMHREGLSLDRFTYISALKGCLIAGDLSFGRQVHALVIQCEVELNTAVMNSLADMYLKGGSKDCAMAVFRRMQQRDIVSWNTMITGFAQEEDWRMVVALFSEMRLTTITKPNHVTFSVIFRLCGIKEDLMFGLQFCCLAYHLGFFNNAHVVNSLINMLSKCCEMEKALSLFNSLPTRSIITWNEMIAGYIINNYSFQALRLFSSIIVSGVGADEFTYSNVLGACHRMQYQKLGEQIHANIIKTGFDSFCSISSSLINAYAGFGLIRSSLKIFQDMRLLDLVSWGSMISSFTKQGFNYETLSLLNCLRERGEEPDEFIFSSVLNACANAATLNQCKCIHSHVIKTGYEKYSCVGSAVIDAYAKCGDIGSAKQAFDDSGDSDAVLFNTMITAYAHHGLILETVEVFERLRAANLYPTHATFVAVISACSHLGLVDLGLCFFDSIVSVYGMCPSRDNFACLVDLHARNGLLEKAKDIIEGMPYDTWPAIWRSLLNGCRIHGNKEISKLATERILELIPSSGAYVLSNVYAEDGRWEDAEKVRTELEEKGVQKVPGYSKIVL